MFLPLFTTKSGGSGVGLHLARSAIRSLGGDVTLLPPTDEAAGGRFALIF